MPIRINNSSISMTIRAVFKCNQEAALKIMLLEVRVVATTTTGVDQILKREGIQSIQSIPASIITSSITSRKCLIQDQLPSQTTKSPNLWSNSSASKIQLTLIQIEHLKTITIHLQEGNTLMNFLKMMGLEFIQTLG